MRMFVLFFVVLIGGCDSGESAVTESFSVPGRIIAANVPDRTSLSVNATIDGRDMYRMEFNNIFSQASVETPGFADEQHEVSITFQFFQFFQSFQYRLDSRFVDIATATKIYNPEPDSGLISFLESEYSWPDDDADGITNRDEVVNGTIE